MRNPLLAALAALALLAPALARAEEATPLLESGPIFALRVGYGVPSGETEAAGAGHPLSALVEAKVPLGFELGYRLSRRFWVELHFDFAPAKPAAALCADGASCSATDARVGAQLQLRLVPGGWIDPWIGAGVGAEVLKVAGREPTSGAHVEWTWAGVEVPFVEAGADVAVSERIGVGPWASLTLARYTSESVKVESGAAVGAGIHARASHGWLAGGLQATLRL
jgi:opacity protein-like surface antigen